MQYIAKLWNRSVLQDVMDAEHLNWLKNQVKTLMEEKSIHTKCKFLIFIVSKAQNAGMWGVAWESVAMSVRHRAHLLFSAH